MTPDGEIDDYTWSGRVSVSLNSQGDSYYTVSHTICGDGIVTTDEVCDEGSSIDTEDRGCETDCGNGIAHTGKV